MIAATCDRARAYVVKMPPAILREGGNLLTFKVAVVLIHGFVLTEAEAWPLMLEYNARCQPPWSEAALRHKLDRAARLTRTPRPKGYLLNTGGASECSVWTPTDSPTPASSSIAWPGVNEDLLKTIVSEGCGLVDLWEASPIRTEDNDPHTEEIIDVLFPDNPLLCCGWRVGGFDTHSREEWRGRLARQQFIVPSPMTAHMGMTQERKLSAHTLENTGPRRFLVIEFDSGSEDDQAGILLHLAEREPLALVVHSGGKSLQGWFFCHGHPEDEVRRFMDYAVSLGADTATWTRFQFVRMPDGVRDNGQRQAVYFFNPEVVKP